MKFLPLPVRMSYRSVGHIYVEIKCEIFHRLEKLIRYHKVIICNVTRASSDTEKLHTRMKINVKVVRRDNKELSIYLSFLSGV